MRRLSVFLLAIFMGASALAQSSAKTATHIVKPGDTLNGLARTYLGDSSRWPEIYRINPQLANPNALTPGQQIRIPLDIRAGSATVAELARRVEKKPEPRPWVPAVRGDTLREKDGIRTFSESSARLTFEDGADLILSEDSLVFLQAIERRRGGRGRDVIEIVDGQADIRTRTRRQASSEIEVIIGTSTVRPSARDGKLETRGRVTPENTAQVMAYGGDTAVEAGGASVAVAQGMGTFVEEGKPPAPPEKLLPAPELRSPLPGESLDELDLAWSPVAEASSYTVEVCADAACIELIDRTTGIDATTHEVELADLGPVYWRVTATSANGLDGYPSAARSLNRVATVSGRLLHDRNGDGVLTDASPLAGTVILLSDAGGSMGAQRIDEASAEADGRYRLRVERPGRYWVAVDSRSLRFSAAKGDLWMEQTHAPAGSICGGSATSAAGPCHGGRRGAVSDDLSSPEGAEHVAVVEIDGSSIAGLDFGFSENVVVHGGDFSGPAGAEQGSLRRFVENANIVEGENAMRFVPALPPGSGGGQWWTVELSDPLPAIIDAGTTIDGRAWTPEGTRVATNPATITPSRAGASMTIDGPELEIGIDSPNDPLLTLDAPAVVRDVSLTGGSPLVVLASGGTELLRVLFGVAPDGKVPDTGGGLALELADAGIRYRMAESLFAGNLEPFSVEQARTAADGECGSEDAVRAPRLLALEWKQRVIRVRGEACPGHAILPFFETDGVLYPLETVRTGEDGTFDVRFEEVGPLQQLGFIAVSPAGVSSPMARREPGQ